MSEAANEEWTVKAAAFLAKALDLDPGLDPIVLAADLAVLKRDPHAAIFAAELDSSVGPAAFLIYVYDLATAGPDGRPGRDFFDVDLSALEVAAERDAPGPRLVAHVRGEREGYILATTPATLRALRGEATAEAIEALAAGPGELLPVGDAAEARRHGAEELLRLLRAANAEAARWLAALRSEGGLLPEDGDAAGATIPFNEAETELALFLLDERSIQSLLRALNMLLTAARQGAEQAFDGSEGDAG
jgi:hypothetical protein